VRVGEENLGDSRIDKNSAKEQAADPDDQAPEIDCAGLQHWRIVFHRPFFGILSMVTTSAIKRNGSHHTAIQGILKALKSSSA